MDLKPIETVYHGYHFRSRLEARWAVFFDTAEIKYDYEPQGFDLDGLWYLPDFYLPDNHCWLEIKPSHSSADDLAKIVAFDAALKAQRNAYVRAHPEGARPYDVLYTILGTPYHDGWTASYDICYLQPGPRLSQHELVWTHCPICDHIDRARVDSFRENGPEGESFCCLHHPHRIVMTRRGFILNSPRLRAAYDAARGARFDMADLAAADAKASKQRERAIATFAYKKYGRDALEEHDWACLEEEFDDWLEWKAEHPDSMTNSHYWRVSQPKVARCNFGGYPSTLRMHP